MPIYDRQCANNHTVYDTYEKLNTPDPACAECGEALKRVLLPGRTGGVIQDSIEGGIWIKHGLCDPETGEPRKYYSHTEIKAEAKRRGLVNHVEHVSEPGSDRSRHTTKWV